MADRKRALEDRVRDLLVNNRVETAAGRYTRPAHRTYPHQWLWDSCFHAMIYVALGDFEYARDELRALFRAQEASGPDRGRLPHMTFIGADETEQDAEAQTAHARDVALWKNPRASTITQPPIVAEAVRRVDDARFWHELWTPLSRYYDWWLRRRDPDGDHLYATWHVWECGADATPRGDAACLRLLEEGRAAASVVHRTVNPTAKKRGDLLEARFRMLEALQAIDADEAEVGEREAQRRREVLLGHEAVDMQAYLAHNLVELAIIGEELGHADMSARYRRAAADIARALNEELWDEEAGFYFDRWCSPEETLRVWTPAPFIALYAHDLVPRERAERLLQHLTDPRSFWTRWPVPTVSRLSESFDADEYWRGSTWMNMNWFVVRGLLASAERFDDERYLAPARTIAARSVELVDELGFREYYRSGAKHPDGDTQSVAAAFGPEDFGWSGLVLELLPIARQAL